MNIIFLGALSLVIVLLTLLIMGWQGSRLEWNKWGTTTTVLGIVTGILGVVTAVLATPEVYGFFIASASPPTPIIIIASPVRKTPTPIVTPIPTDTPTSTEILNSSTPAITSSPTTTPTRTSTLTPTLTFVPTPPLTPTYTPTITPNILLDLPKPILIAPEEGTEFAPNVLPELEWEWSGNLEEDQYYFVDARFIPENCIDEWLYFKWTKETGIEVDPWLNEIMCPAPNKRSIRWTVYVGLPTGSLEEGDGIQLSFSAEPRNFSWRTRRSAGGIGEGDSGIDTHSRPPPP